MRELQKEAEAARCEWAERRTEIALRAATARRTEAARREWAERRAEAARCAAEAV